MKLLLLPARAAEEQRRKGAQHQPEVAPQRPVHLFAFTQRPLNCQPSRPVDEIGRENSGPVETDQLRLKVAQRVSDQPDPARQHISETRRTAPQRRLRPHFRQPQRTPGKIEYPPETQLSAQRAKQQAGHRNNTESRQGQDIFHRDGHRSGTVAAAFEESAQCGCVLLP